jgi:TRAP-type C4-dicarboxylate transport system permease small subunit
MQPSGLFDRSCRALAILGGLLLLLLAALTVVSVTGRYFFSRPIPGDIELTALLTACAVSMCLPYCQLRDGNVIVDALTTRLPERAKAALDALGAVLLALVFAVIAWRLLLGGLEMHAYRDESMMLRLPTWWAFAIMTPCFALVAAAGLVTAWRRLRRGA